MLTTAGLALRTARTTALSLRLSGAAAATGGSGSGKRKTKINRTQMRVSRKRLQFVFKIGFFIDLSYINKFLLIEPAGSIFPCGHLPRESDIFQLYNS
jgi:hypothetical protein